MSQKFLQIAVASPLRFALEYLPPLDTDISQWQPGIRVQVPLRNKPSVGVLMGITETPDCPVAKMKAASNAIDQEPVLTPHILELCDFASRYYHYPIGEVVQQVLPAKLRQGKPADLEQQTFYRLTDAGLSIDLDSLKRAPRQAALVKLLQKHPAGLEYGQLRLQDVDKNIINPLLKKELLEEFKQDLLPVSEHTVNQTNLALNNEQHKAVELVNSKLNEFNAFLLEGITGSGKTEVYLQIIDAVLKAGKQALILVPEIALTPQTIRRFNQRFAEMTVALHSSLNETERAQAWNLARLGHARIVIGTRSAIFTPMPDLGAIIIDEEHDGSFKQQEGFRYSARDIALVRGQKLNLPVVLGSATPCLESLYNALQDRYQHLTLWQRAGNAKPPEFRLIDIRKQKLVEGLSQPLLEAMRETIKRGEQVMLFINRRGYAPTILCHQCGWIADCRRCDAHLTLHHNPDHLLCHHCGSEHSIPSICPECQQSQLITVGAGTERIEQAIEQAFPGVGIARVDRDSTRRKGSMQEILTSIRKGEKQILIGTQMLAKGHHFPDVTLVGILNADSGLYSCDFRATERVGQLLLQVAGRAGRAEKPGTVYIQTYNPDHPLLTKLLTESYHNFALAALEERQAALLPPFSFLALFRAEAMNKHQALQFLEQVKMAMSQIADDKLQTLGPIPAPMEKRAGRYRAQLLLLCADRRHLQRRLSQVIAQTEQLKDARKVRWSLDVDPLDML